MEEIDTMQAGTARASGPQFLKALRTGERSGQAIVEFAMVSFAFFSIVFGTIDFGRAIFMYSELTNAVREGARYGKIQPNDAANIKATVRDKAPSLGGSDASGNSLLTIENPTCKGTDGALTACYPGCANITVAAEYEFTPIVAQFLGIHAPIELKASTKVEAE